MPEISEYLNASKSLLSSKESLYMELDPIGIATCYVLRECESYIPALIHLLDSCVGLEEILKYFWTI